MESSITLISPGLFLGVHFLCLSDESLRVCVHPGPSCCTSKMEDSYVAAVRSETQQKMRSYSFELKYLIAGHIKAYQGERGSLRIILRISDGWRRCTVVKQKVCTGLCATFPGNYPVRVAGGLEPVLAVMG